MLCIEGGGLFDDLAVLRVLDDAGDAVFAALLGIVSLGGGDVAAVSGFQAIAEPAAFAFAASTLGGRHIGIQREVVGN